MRILGIETSCDETGASIIEDGTRIISNIVTSSLSIHAKTGGIIPENAAREQIKCIIPVIKEALVSEINAIAVTVGPGLIGSLLVGVETAKTLAYVWGKPIVPVNHLVGHIYANWLGSEKIEFPVLALVVSGGHTDLVLMRDHRRLKWLGGTRDDAAGEAFDKIGRLLGLPYPGGPAIEKVAITGITDRFTFPRPMIDTDDFDFSFSGLKTAVRREILRYEDIKKLSDKDIADIAASVQKAIVDILVAKTLKAAKEYRVKSILLSGGVAANQLLREVFIQNTKYIIPNTRVFVPIKTLCTDNGAMIASAAFFNFKPVPWQEIVANPELHF